MLPLTYISDTIDAANRSNTTYSGTGLHLKYQLPSGQWYEDDILWTDPSITLTGTPAAYKWEFKPENYHPTQNVQGQTDYLTGADFSRAYYEITYTTDVDVSDKLEDINVKNGADSDYGHGTQTVVVGPDEENKFNAQKSVIHNDVTNGYVTWSISIQVPPQGFDTLTVEDVYPNSMTETDPARRYQDEFDSSFNITVTGLVGHERYTIDTTSDPTKMSIVFYRDSGDTTGLTDTGTARDVNVTFRTKTDPDWLSDYPSYRWIEAWHVNNAKVTANGTEKDTSAIAYLGSPRFIKNAGAGYEKEINGELYRVFPYSILLSQVNTDNITITDEFNTSLLSYYVDNSHRTNGVPANWWSDREGTIIGGLGSNTWKPDEGIGLLEMTPTATGMELHTDWIPKKGDGYWPEYLVSYSLIAKVSDLEARAAQHGGTYSVKNHASFGTLKDDLTVDYGYDKIDKEIIHAVDKSGEYAEYRITLNPLKATLNEGRVMELTDKLTNLSLDYNSIQIVTDPAGRENDITYDMSGDTVT